MRDSQTATIILENQVDKEGEGSLLSEQQQQDVAILTPDLSLNNNGRRCSPSSPQDRDHLFEFCFASSSDQSTTTATADELFLNGHILPFVPHQQQQLLQEKKMSNKKTHRHRRSMTCISSNDTSTLLPHSRVEEDQRTLRRAVSDYSSTSGQFVARPPRWYLFVFGSVRVPAAMEMKDIKVRQSRRRAATLHAAEKNSGGALPKLVRSLSCKAIEGAAVVTPATAPFRHVNYL